ncbi:NAD(P)-dependent alcohol dehydrogenase [Rhodococcoides yunnanense]|jgi:NADPH:quinone reductase-like Zn-dependent oxidoreductase|uniref:NAD(P)-dependent alcohol dehydrogenase n=1 Tax=Rhodococcoides yunnanense TaxID=278209 RepID=UPI0022B1E344|nr:NAD(P)-dependent alcohol dehydrogenase [Rhodococcus yunnanensis]MCZ4274630.1 NAD(P)-dependent alcohol dehydrogenase [Rhodococcus yunnanensis]
MKAIIQDRYGRVRDVMHLGDMDRSTPDGDQVLVKVHAAGVDRGALHLMTGEPRLLKLAFGLRKPRTPVRGREFAGVVEQVGPESTANVGDRVYGIAGGAFAEYLCASPKKYVPMPSALSFVDAAALPISGVTALQAIRDHAKIAAGQKVLIIGASGGVGSIAVRIAVDAGAVVTAVCSEAKAAYVEKLGAKEVLDYRKPWTGVSGFDAILDIGGGNALSVLRRMLTRSGVLVIVGAETGGPIFGGIDRQLRATMLSPFVKQRLIMQFAKEARSDIEELGRMATAGTFENIVTRTYPLSETATALEDLANGVISGKAVIEVS